MDTETTTSVWEFLELPNTQAPQAESLYRWGLNFEMESNPFRVYLNLIGWTEENFGEVFPFRTADTLGYAELAFLGDALNEYANAPQQVYAWVTELMNCEGV